MNGNTDPIEAGNGGEAYKWNCRADDERAAQTHRQEKDCHDESEPDEKGLADLRKTFVSIAALIKDHLDLEPLGSGCAESRNRVANISRPSVYALAVFDPQGYKDSILTVMESKGWSWLSYGARYIGHVSQAQRRCIAGSQINVVKILKCLELLGRTQLYVEAIVDKTACACLPIGLSDSVRNIGNRQIKRCKCAWRDL